MAKIYVSYNQRDKGIAARVVEGLRNRKHTVLWDADLLRAGLDWRVVLAQALRDAPVVVSILTKNSVSASFIAYPPKRSGTVPFGAIQWTSRGLNSHRS
jgi:hypothetical protein